MSVKTTLFLSCPDQRPQWSVNEKTIIKRVKIYFSKFWIDESKNCAKCNSQFKQLNKKEKIDLHEIINETVIAGDVSEVKDKINKLKEKFNKMSTLTYVNVDWKNKFLSKMSTTKKGNSFFI